MEWNRETVKNLLLVTCGGIAFFCGLQNLPAVAGAFGWLFGILSPFLLGGALAFVLNVPMRAIERHLFAKSRRAVRLRRPLALIAALAAVTGVLTLASVVIGPGVTDAVKNIAGQIPDAFDRISQQLLDLGRYWPQVEETVRHLAIDWKSLSQKLLQLAQSWGGSLLTTGGGVIGGVVSGVSTFVIGLIFSFYLLLQKEKLSKQGKQVLYALLPVPQADRTVEILRLANKTFSSFLSGQSLEACILGTMFAVSMTLFHLPYALLVGVLIAVTALIPIVGAFIGCVVGALLIAVTDPWKALFFVMLFLVLQQIEGNLIYPHVVGSSVGLPSIWVLVAVTLGGKLMGIAGMLFFIPLCSVLYALFREMVKRRLAARHIPPEKWLK